MKRLYYEEENGEFYWVKETQKGFVIERQQLINYLGSFQKVVLNCFRDLYNSQISPLTVEQNVANIIKLISRELEE